MHADDQDQYDHIGLQAQWLGMPAPPRTEVDVNPKEGDTLTLGGVVMQVLHTPGHTQGSVALYIPAENLLVGGDTLFRDSIGRTDLPGGDP
jgi:glyoxylase-like metal-dependent hydrolase (beta-lactamase superfamily II)